MDWGVSWWCENRCALVLFACAWWLSACGSSTDGGSGGGTPTSSAGTSSTSVPECPTYQSCDCGGGITSFITCDAQGTQSCDCSKCPTFSPPTAAPFACGGRVFGVWRLKSTSYVGGALLSQTGVNNPITCPENLTVTPPSGEFLLDLEDGGRAEGTELSLGGNIQFLGSCAGQILGVSECDEITIGGEACTGSCGLCTCASPPETLEAQDFSLWSTTGTSLTLQIDELPVTYDYCATDTELTLRRAGVDLVFDSVTVGGSPQDCATRTADTCAVGDGCHAGNCGPSATCALFGSEADCNVNSACSWQAAGCAGTPALTCGLADYGKVPGCDFVAPGTVCQGTQQACADRTVDACTEGDGCAVSGICDGGTWDCTQICVIGYGCLETDSGCIGSGSCALGTSEAACTENLSDLGCVWKPGCAGTVKPCSAYDLSDCVTHPGCTLGTP
jgi:hypothetical protein